MKVFNKKEEAAATELTRKPRSLLRPSKYISCFENKAHQLRLATAGMCLTQYRGYKSCPGLLFKTSTLTSSKRR